MKKPQTEIEIRLWCDEFYRTRQTRTAEFAMNAADDLVADYRTRYEQPQPPADDRLGRAAIEAMDAILKVMGDKVRSNQQKVAAIDRIATQYRGPLAH